MATEIIEGTAIEVAASTEEPVRALVPTEATAAVANPLWDLGALTDEEFERRQDMLKTGVARIRTLQQSILTKGQKPGEGDWGEIPGVNKPLIYKSGAEKLAAFYKLVATFDIDRDEKAAADLGYTYGPAEARPPRIIYTVRAELHAGSLDGPVVGEGVGVCSSWERRYLYRQGSRVCPVCGKDTIIKGRAEYGGGWLCFAKKGGCGTKWGDGDKAIEGQEVGDAIAEPPDENTLVKMATKRAHVDGVLRTLGASALFTQDLEDTVPPPLEQPMPATPRPPVADRAPAAGGAGYKPDVDGIKGKIKAVPDGIRDVKRPDWMPIGTPENVKKLELAITGPGNRKHTAFVTGDLAYRLMEAFESGAIAVDDKVLIFGELHEVKWAEDKPTRLEIRNVTRIEFPDTLDVVLVSSPPAPDHDDGLFDAAGVTFGSDLPPATGEVEEVYAGTLSVLDFAWQQGKDRQFAHARFVGAGKRYEGGMAYDEAMVQLWQEGKGWNYQPGQVVQVVGTWIRNGDFLMLTAVAP